LGSYIKQGNATVLGAFENESLVGFLWLYKHDFYGEPRVHINHIAVSKQFRGKGIGKRLIQEAESLAKYDGIGAIDLFVSEINVRAMNVYDAIGFKTERRYMSKKLL
jgi:ribosomal protein S18 acetylase RimI-like enzyme